MNIIIKKGIHLGLSRSAIPRTFKNAPHLFPYTHHIAQVLQKHDYKAHIEFLNRCTENTKLDKSCSNLDFLLDVTYTWMQKWTNTT